MTKKLPKISIITPSYNQGQFIEETILSVINQNYPNLEYIIIDGGSTDNSVEIIKKYQHKLTYWVSEPDKGQTHAINKGIKKATGEIITWLNSDDYYQPEILHYVARKYTDKKWSFFFQGAARSIDNKGKELKIIFPIVFTEKIKTPFKVRMPQPASFFTIELYKKFGTFDEDLHYAMDMDFWLFIAYSNIPMYKTDKIITNFRIHEDAKSQAGNLPFILDIINKYEKILNQNSNLKLNAKDYKKILALHYNELIEDYYKYSGKQFKYIYKMFFLNPTKAIKLFIIHFFTFIKYKTGNIIKKY